MFKRDADIEIETYKGQTIYYDPMDDKFKCEISIEDRSKTTKRQSLKEVRSMIDTFAKENLEFKPFKYLKKDGWGSREFVVYEVSALRNDGKFVVRKSTDKSNWGASFEGKKELQQAMVFDPVLIAKAEKLKADFEKVKAKYYEEVDALIKQMKPIDLSQYEGILK